MDSSCPRVPPSCPRWWKLGHLWMHPPQQRSSPVWVTLLHLRTWQVWYSLSLSPPCPHLFPLPHAHATGHTGFLTFLKHASASPRTFAQAVPSDRKSFLFLGHLYGSSLCGALRGFAEVSGLSRSPYFKLYTCTPPLFTAPPPDTHPRAPVYSTKLIHHRIDFFSALCVRLIHGCLSSS